MLQLRFFLRAAAIAGVATAPHAAFAQDPANSGESVCPGGGVSCTIGDRIIYLPRFFDQFRPITALDMVSRVPGFSIDAGSDVRGFGGAAGNVLIDGERVSAKSESIDTILGRIAAKDVARIEVIRGGAGGLDTNGAAIVVNVIRIENGGRGGAPWSFSLIKRQPGGLRPQGEISYSDKVFGADYTAGASFYATSNQNTALERVTHFGGVNENRQRDGAFRNQGGSVNFRLKKSFTDRDVATLGATLDYNQWHDRLDELRLPQAGPSSLARFDQPQQNLEGEIAGDFEHEFSNAFSAKLIGLINRRRETYVSSFDLTPFVQPGDRSQFDSERRIGETIGRVEVNWTGVKSHAIQFGGELAENFIDSAASLFFEDNMGALQPVPINGANTRVTELRGEPFIKDSWSVSPSIKLDAGFAVEFSTITQSGDNAVTRSFTYPKLSLVWTHKLGDKLQYRLSAKREVSQLSFSDFVSNVNFDNENIDFGNPDLRPQRSWVFETTLERRFGDIGVIELTGFYNAVTDVEDLLPIAGTIEVPGNIGNGNIYGGHIKMTAPLDFAGFRNARLDASATIRDSNVIDPVTGVTRDFSFTPDKIYDINFRQDFTRARVSWGFYANNSTPEFRFGIDEITAYSHPPLNTGLFVETTAIKGVKIRLERADLFNQGERRDRLLYAGPRNLGVLLRREDRTTHNGGPLMLTFSGNL
ncbi:MAG: TonB-dependent receptor plug domain-containing protein [Parvularculaceae bacterium]